jgi:hypothetical protein
MMPQHIHQTTRLRTSFHSTRADPLSHVLDLFQPASAVSRTLVCVDHHDIRFNLHYGTERSRTRYSQSLMSNAHIIATRSLGDHSTN